MVFLYIRVDVNSNFVDLPAYQVQGSVQPKGDHKIYFFQQGLITNYKASWGDDTVQTFLIGNLSSSGYDYLELIRNDRVWQKIKDEIKKKKLPQTIEEIARVAGIFTGQVIKELNL